LQQIQHRGSHFAIVLAASEAARAELLMLHRTACLDDQVLRLLESELNLEEPGARHALGDEAG